MNISLLGKLFYKKKKYKTANDCKMNPENTKTNWILFAKIMFR